MSMPTDADDVGAAATLMSLQALDPDDVLAQLQDPTVDSAFADAVSGASEGMRGGRKKGGRAGGVKRKAEGEAGEAEGSSEAPAPSSASAAATAANAAASNASAEAPSGSAPPAKRSRVATLVDGLKAKVAQVRPYATTGLTVAAVGTALNRPTVYGNLARLVAEIIKTGTNQTITSTWQDWGQTILDIGRSIGVVGELLDQQSRQGPVVPVSIATAIMAYRAQKAGKTLGQLIRDDAEAVGAGVRSLAKSQLDAFNAAVRAEGLRSNVATLKLIAQRARQSQPTGEGAAALTAAVTSLGAPAVGSTGLVQNRATGPFSAAIAPLTSADPAAVADAAAARAAAGALLALADSATPAPAADAGDDELGGRRRRKTRKGRKPRRRVTLRRKRATRKAPKFVY